RVRPRRRRQHRHGKPLWATAHRCATRSQEGSMSPEGLTAYMTWTVTPKAPSPHSRLYHLAPIGVGTPDVEGVSSYTARLAAAHGVPVRTLVTREVIPLLGRRHLAHPVNNSLSSFWVTGSPSLQGGGTLARDWVQVLETLTL